MADNKTDLEERVQRLERRVKVLERLVDSLIPECGRRERPQQRGRHLGVVPDDDDGPDGAS